MIEGGETEELASTPAKMTANLQTHLRAAVMEDKRYTMLSFRVEEVASRNMDLTAMGVLKEYVGRNCTSLARRYVGVTASAAAAGVKRSHEKAFIEVGVLPLSEQFARFRYSAPAGELTPN